MKSCIALSALLLALSAAVAVKGGTITCSMMLAGDAAKPGLPQDAALICATEDVPQGVSIVMGGKLDGQMQVPETWMVFQNNETDTNAPWSTTINVPTGTNVIIQGIAITDLNFSTQYGWSLLTVSGAASLEIRNADFSNLRGITYAPLTILDLPDRGASAMELKVSNMVCSDVDATCLSLPWMTPLSATSFIRDSIFMNGGKFYRCLGLNTVTKMTLSNVHFVNCSNGYGVALLINNVADTITIANSSFADNKMGGLQIFNTTTASQVNIYNTTFVRNSAYSGAGLAMDGGPSNASSYRITNITRCAFVNNTAGDRGAAINVAAVLPGSMYINNSTFEGNYAGAGPYPGSQVGGAVCIQGVNGSVNLDRVVALYNRAAESGGFMSVTQNTAFLLVKNSSIYNNSAGTGGAFYLTGNASFVNFQNSVVRHNIAGSAGAVAVNGMLTGRFFMQATNMTSNRATGSYAGGVRIQRILGSFNATSSSNLAGNNDAYNSAKPLIAEYRLSGNATASYYENGKFVNATADPSILDVPQPPTSAPTKKPALKPSPAKKHKPPPPKGKGKKGSGHRRHFLFF